MSGGAILEVHDEVTNLTVIEQVIGLYEIADFALAADRIAASLATMEGQMLVALGASTWGVVTPPASSGLMMQSDMGVSGKVKWDVPPSAPVYVAVHNNDASTLTPGDIVVLDPTYTTSLGVKLTTTLADLRLAGVIINSSISSNGNGSMATEGIQSVHVTGAVVFGHSLIASTTAGYAQDSGGGGYVKGMIGYALGSQASGNGTINCLVYCTPQLYTAATPVVEGSIYALDTASVTLACGSNINRVVIAMVFGGNANGGAMSNPSTAPTVGGTSMNLLGGTAYSGSGIWFYGYTQTQGLGTGNQTVVGAQVAGGTNPHGTTIFVAISGAAQSSYYTTVQTQNGLGTNASVGDGVLVVPDLVICGCGYTQSSVYAITAHGGGQTPRSSPYATASLGGVYLWGECDSAPATSTSMTFTWTSSSAGSWSAGGAISIHSA